MSEDTPPPTPLPPAAQSPYPVHPAPHPQVAHRDHVNAPTFQSPTSAVEGEGAVRNGASGAAPRTLMLIGGGLAAAAVAIALTLPLFRAKPPVKRKARKRRKNTRAK